MMAQYPAGAKPDGVPWSLTEDRPEYMRMYRLVKKKARALEWWEKAPSADRHQLFQVYCDNEKCDLVLEMAAITGDPGVMYDQ